MERCRPAACQVEGRRWIASAGEIVQRRTPSQSASQQLGERFVPRCLDRRAGVDEVMAAQGGT